MPKVKLEKVTGVVALSYLVLIPVGGYLAYQKVQKIDKATAQMWEAVSMKDDYDTDVSLASLRDQLGRKLDTAR